MSKLKPHVGRHKKLLKAIRTLEKKCLSADSKRSTVDDFEKVGRSGTRHYYQWLQQQAPLTALAWPEFDEMWRS